MIKRPKPGDNEEDILRMQEEYLQEKHENGSITPAAQVVNLRTQNINSPVKTESEPRLVSKYAKNKGLYSKEDHSSTSNSVMGDILEKNIVMNIEQQEHSDGQQTSQHEDDKIHSPKIIPSVLGNIVEKNITSSMDLDSAMPSDGFPNAPKIDFAVAGNSKSATTKSNEPMDFENTECDANSSSLSLHEVKINKAALNQQLNLPEKSYILSSKDADNIHSENVNKLQNMSESDILENQKLLYKYLDPNCIDFLKSQRKKIPAGNTPKNSSEKVEGDDVKDTGKDIPIPGASDLMWDNEILSHPDVNCWLNFETLEKEKVQWMKSIHDVKVEPNVPFEARFDFNGTLLPYAMELNNKNKALFHHGEEPHRPGYTLSELFGLSRSAVTQQRVIALNTIAGILDFFSTGYYKNLIDIPLTKIFFIVRIAMDENRVMLLGPALKAMRNLLYHKIDEAYLDALLGFEEGTQQPCLENDLSEIDALESKESELKDFHLAEIDLLTVLLRTNILQRIYYILNTVKPNFNCVQYSLQILTRIARDSDKSATEIIEMEHLMECIISNFVPITGTDFVFDPSMIYQGKPILPALKLLRVLSLQSPEIASSLVEKYEIMRPISEYLSSVAEGTYGLKIQTESFCIVTSFVIFDVGSQEIKSLFPVIIAPLFKHVQCTDVFSCDYTLQIPSFTHAAVVLQLINKLLKNTSYDALSQQAYPLLIQGVRKWVAQLVDSALYSFEHLRLLASAFDCCGTLFDRIAPMDFLAVTLSDFAKSDFCTLMMNQLIVASNLLSKLGSKDQHQIKNLVTLGAAINDRDLQMLPILGTMSPIPFMASLFKLLEQLNEPSVSELFMTGIKPYLKKLAHTTPCLCDNWFTRTETDFVFSAIKIALKLEMSESQKDLLYAIASKLCYVLRIDKKYELEVLFSRIVFNKDVFTAERLVNLLSVSDSEGFSKVLTSIEDIKECYNNVINMGYVSTGPSVVLRNWKKPILPRDWIYLPILSLYSKHQDMEEKQMVEGKEAAPSKEFIVACSLEWILFNELCFSDLLRDINVTDRFCRIMCVYLCDNSLFLDKHINSLLRRCMRKIFQEEKRQPFNFDRQLTGLNNFQDFYTQLLEQFQAVSYGDPGFAAALLAPVAQSHDPKWRKLLWSEYAACLRALDCPEDFLCYDLDAYLIPEEQDESLIRSYARALTGNLLREGTVAHKIATHHVDCFKKRSNRGNNSEQGPT